MTWYKILFIFVLTARQIEQISTQISRHAYLYKEQLKISASSLGFQKTRWQDKFTAYFKLFHATSLEFAAYFLWNW